MIVLATFVCLRFAVTLKCLCDDTVARRGATRLGRRRERREGEKYRERERKRKKREK